MTCHRKDPWAAQTRMSRRQGTRRQRARRRRARRQGIQRHRTRRRDQRLGLAGRRAGAPSRTPRKRTSGTVRPGNAMPWPSTSTRRRSTP
ncbi:hypothetical protein ACFFX0_15110 [Citricoccus parietis]|uniref:Uncharacterized protein n=1 Tax=Citricoccus parietis TaxID=592307 RepID=A0ABV5G0M4_9MICC